MHVVHRRSCPRTRRKGEQTVSRHPTPRRVQSHRVRHTTLPHLASEPRKELRSRQAKETTYSTSENKEQTPKTKNRRVQCILYLSMQACGQTERQRDNANETKGGVYAGGEG
ncbi:hypothetical protein PENSPDRAFT_213338 [Peniophora sp. CONT]|nr:hypothetical protein PENSPDRAFT_213338 [Peniophora sp. CONT]